MNTGLSTHLFVFHELNKETVSLIGDYGFNCLEIWGMRPHFDYHNSDYVKKIKKHLYEKNIKVTSFHAPVYRFVGDGSRGLWLKLSDTNEENRKAAVSETIKLLKAAEIFQPLNFVLHTDIQEEKTDECIKNLMKSLSELEGLADGLGIKLALESGIHKSTASESIINILKVINKPLYGACVDVGHANVIEDSQSAIDRCAANLIEIHASDNNGEADLHAVPGDGNIDWHAVMESLRNGGFTGNFVFEIMDPFRDNSKSINILKPILERLKKFRNVFDI